MEVNNCEQSAFLPFRFILDNIMLTQETLSWVEYSKQDLLFQKLDFSKAFNMVDWSFLFKTMIKLGFPNEFIQMIKLLFSDAVACVKVNGALFSSSGIGRGIKQGCAIAPYLFFIAAEVLNLMVKADLAASRVKEIRLPVESR